jgi:hypothetical protein
MRLAMAGVYLSLDQLLNAAPPLRFSCRYSP